MSLGPSFINVFDGYDEAAEEAAFALTLRSTTRIDGPLTFWISRPVTLRGDYAVPANVTLSFAPGAYLILHGGLTLSGPIDAGLERRFALFGRATLSLLGPLEEIVADWWLPTEGRSAVERALDALWERYRRELPPAPIRLDGPYPLNGTLRIKPPADLPDATGRIEVRLSGQWGRELDPPTFIVGFIQAEEALSAMVSVEEGVVLDIDHVAFDASRPAGQAPADSCLSFEGTFDESRVEACFFRYDGAGVRVSPRIQHWREVLASTGGTAEGVRLLTLGDAIRLSTGSTNRIEVSRCLFRGASVEGRAVSIEFGAPTSFRALDCQFVGVFANAIAILGGELDVTACQFANEATSFFHYSDKNISPLATVDLLVRRWGDDAWRVDTIFEPKDAPDIRDLDPGQVVNVHRGRPLANTHVTVTHCVSTSPCFLIMSQTFPYPDTVKGGVVLTNVRHAPNERYRTSVSLGAGAPPRALMLQGCWFGGSVILETGSQPDAIVDLGTTFGDSIVPARFRSETTGGVADVITLASTRP